MSLVLIIFVSKLWWGWWNISKWEFFRKKRTNINMRGWNTSTFHTAIRRFKIRLELLVARASCFQLFIWNPQLAAMSPRATFVYDVKDICWATNVSKVSLDTASELHAAIAGRVHHNHLIILTRGNKRLQLTVLPDFCKRGKKMQKWWNIHYFENSFWADLNSTLYTTESSSKMQEYPSGKR